MLRLFSVHENHCHPFSRILKRPETRTARRLSAALLLTPLLAGCFGPPTVTGPTRIIEVKDEADALRAVADIKPNWQQYLDADEAKRKAYRNEVVAARMYAIDLNYTEYERKLNVEGESIEFWTRLSSGTLTTIAGAVPVAHTARGLNAIATGANLGQAAYNETFFRKQMMQNLITAMRSARQSLRTTIRRRLACASDAYSLGMALSDVESYFRAGTFETGLMRLTNAVHAEEKKTREAAATSDSTAARAVAEVQTAEAKADAAKANAALVCNLPWQRRASLTSPAASQVAQSAQPQR